MFSIVTGENQYETRDYAFYVEGFVVDLVRAIS
jgi:hypothetical protein